ncbi:MAG TPA: DNA alkylation repair protein [Vicinamibacterales bacterium]
MTVHAAVALSKIVRRDLAALPKQDAPSVRRLRRRHSKALERESPEVVLEFVRLLLRDASWAERVVAWETLARHRFAFAHVDDQLAEEMAEGLSDWGSVDLYAVTVLGRAWRDGRISDSLLSCGCAQPTDGAGGLLWWPPFRSIRGLGAEAATFVGRFASAGHWSQIVTIWSSRRCRGPFGN